MSGRLAAAVSSRLGRLMGAAPETSSLALQPLRPLCRGIPLARGSRTGRAWTRPGFSPAAERCAAVGLLCNWGFILPCGSRGAGLPAGRAASGGVQAVPGSRESPRLLGHDPECSGSRPALSRRARAVGISRGRAQRQTWGGGDRRELGGGKGNEFVLMQRSRWVQVNLCARPV